MRILYIQPQLTSYRVPLVKSWASKYELFIACDNVDLEQGFGDVGEMDHSIVLERCEVVPIAGGRIFWQRHAISTFVKVSASVTITFANPRFITTWLIMILAKLLHKKIIIHGQGLYAHDNPSFLRRLMYRSMCFLSTRYVAYTPLSASTMTNIGVNSRKIAVAENSLNLQSTISPSLRDFSGTGVLFIGRVRDRSSLDVLIEAISCLREEGHGITLEVIGDGPLFSLLKQNSPAWINWHGALYDEAQIARISLGCRIGCHPGDAGLSVVHFLALSLPVVIHSSVSEHMGPEPSYVTGKEGYFFNKARGAAGLASTLVQAWNAPVSELRSKAENAFSLYENLSQPDLAARFCHIIDDVVLNPAGESKMEDS